MSDCNCGARGIDLDGHECVAWLRLEVIRRDERIQDLEHALSDAQSENVVLRDQISEAWSAHGEMQRQLSDAKDDLKRWDGACWYCATPDIEDPWRHEHEPNGGHWHHCIDPGDGLPSDCANSDRLERVTAELRREISEQDERILELEQQLGIEVPPRKRSSRPLVEFIGAAPDLHCDEDAEFNQLEQQLKAAQERLAEAEQLLRDVLETTPVDEHGYQWGMRGLKEYFAKHEPAIDPTAEIDPPELESDEPEKTERG